jgi:hypothetical protein
MPGHVYIGGLRMCYQSWSTELSRAFFANSESRILLAVIKAIRCIVITHAYLTSFAISNARVKVALDH